MRFAADLHLHSHHSKAVSPQMTLPTMAGVARRKGIDVLGTGDCLQGDWLNTLDRSLEQREGGWYELRSDLAGKAPGPLPKVWRERPLRFVPSTEVSCLTSSEGRLRGIHHLIYFPTLNGARSFREKVARFGDLREGRPTLGLTSRELLELVKSHDDACHLAPAHVMNPYFSSLGTIEGHRTLEEIFGDLAGELLAVETGLTSTPEMCRRVSSLDRHSLFSCSDAHSPENLGRECTIFDVEPTVPAMFAALRRGVGIAELHKFPLERTRYYRNWCSACAEAFPGQTCPNCGRRLVTGSHDRLEAVLADRRTPALSANAPIVRSHLPLRFLVAGLCGSSLDGKPVTKFCDALISAVGPERFVLTEADFDALAAASTPQIARAIVAQRAPEFDFRREKPGSRGPTATQPTLF